MWRAVLAFPLALLIGAWATAPVAEQIAAILFGGVADGLRAVGIGVGVGLAIGIGASLPILAAPRRPRAAQYTALPRPVSRWELPSGQTVEGEWYEVEERGDDNGTANRDNGA